VGIAYRNPVIPESIMGNAHLYKFPLMMLQIRSPLAPLFKGGEILEDSKSPLKRGEILEDSKSPLKRGI
jgi:hypothetical protein